VIVGCRNDTAEQIRLTVCKENQITAAIKITPQRCWVRKVPGGRLRENKGKVTEIVAEQAC